MKKKFLKLNYENKNNKKTDLKIIMTPSYINNN